MNSAYNQWIKNKSQLDGNFGFEPNFMPSFLKDFQAFITEWAIKKGRAAIFADCGLGKSPMGLVWAWNIYKHTGKPTLILTPLAVANQFEQEGEKFQIEAARSKAGEIEAPIVITNYERLHFYNPNDFGGVYCDESSILKSFDGVRKAQITEFMRTKKYRLLGTATAAPNDFTEVGTSSEALGYLGYMDMLGRFFTNRQKTTHHYRGKYQLTNNQGWRFKGHAEEKFWRWMSSWAIALRKPSDLGFDDNGFNLPPLEVNHHVIQPNTNTPGMLFNLPAIGWREQRAERKRTINERCEMIAELVNNTGKSATVWCDYNPEGDLLTKLIPDAQQVSGRDSDDSKEEKFNAFSNGELRVLVTKPKIGAWGLNWQHCSHAACFPSNSYERYYQLVRRHYRFGQKNKVVVDMITTPGGEVVLKNQERKEKQADQMFTNLVKHMTDSIEIDRKHTYDKKAVIPSWL